MAKNIESWGRSDGYFVVPPASLNSWTMVVHVVCTCIWGTGTQYLAFLEFEHLFPFALLPNQSTINMTVFPSFHTDSNYGCNTKDFYCCFFGHHKSILDLLQVHCAKKKQNINQMKSFTDPHNGGMNTITAACYK